MENLKKGPVWSEPLEADARVTDDDAIIAWVCGKINKDRGHIFSNATTSADSPQVIKEAVQAYSRLFRK